MIVSDNFKKRITEYGKEITIKLSCSSVVLEKNGIISCTKSFKGDLFKTVMQSVDIEIKGKHNLKDTDISIEFGVRYDAEEYDYINYGQYIIDYETIEYSVENDSTKFTAYDYLYKAHVLYDLNIVYPITIKEYLELICERLGYTLTTKQFINSDNIVYEEKYLGSYQATFRDVLDQIAACAGGIILLDGNELSIKCPTETEYVIDEHNLKSLTLNDKYGPINSLVLSLQPQNDDYYRQDIISIEENGRTEIKISNNELMSKDRELFIDNLFDNLNGLYFYPFTFECFGFGYFSPCDVIIVKNLEGIEHKCLILNNTINVTTGISETVGCDIPGDNQTDYSKATQDEKLLYETILTVDKQNKVIEAVVKQEKESAEQISDLKISVDGIQTEVSKTTESIYKFESGTGNIFENCNQYVSKNKGDEGEVLSSDMPLGIARDYIRGKDICIAVDVKVINAQLNTTLGNYVGAEFSVGYKDGTKKTYQTRWYLGQFSLQYLLTTATNDCDKRIYQHFKIEDKEITSVSNLKIIISLDADKAVVANAKVEFGTYPTGYQFDVPYIRDNITVIQKDYTQIKQEVSTLSLQAVSMEQEITTIKGDTTTLTTRLNSAEIRLQPTNILLAVNEQIGANGKLYSTKFILDLLGVHISGGGLDISNNSGEKVLYADKNGNLTIKNLNAINGNFSGVVNATSGTFRGTIYASAGTFTGVVTSNSGTIGGWNVNDKGLSNGSVKIDKSGVTNIYTWADLAVIQMIIMGTITLGGQETSHYDFNGDGKVTAADYLILKNRLIAL